MAMGGPRLILNNIKNARLSFGRVIRAYLRGDITREEYRDIVYGLSHYLGYLKVEIDLDLEQEIEEIKAMMGELQCDTPRMSGR